MSANAQKLIVTLNNNTTEEFNTNQIQSIKFGTSTMILKENDGTVNTWQIPDIHHYSFAGPTGVENVLTEGKSHLTVYPNPSAGEVTIDFAISQPARVTVDIIDASGKLIKFIYQGEQTTSQIYKWNGSTFAGTYFCRIVTDTKVLLKPIIIQ